MTFIKEVKLYDRKFNLVRTEPVDLISVRSSMDLSSNVSLTLDQDLLLVSMKSAINTTIHVYKLRGCSDKEQPRNRSSRKIVSPISRYRRAHRRSSLLGQLRRHPTLRENYSSSSSNSESEV